MHITRYIAFESLVSLAYWSRGPGINDTMDIADSYLADLTDLVDTDILGDANENRLLTIAEVCRYTCAQSL